MSYEEEGSLEGLGQQYQGSKEVIRNVRGEQGWQERKGRKNKKGEKLEVELQEITR